MGTNLFLNLVIDEVDNKVVYAEADRDFVDVLLSFLGRPVGSAVRLAGDELNLGCMDSLYKGVDGLDAKYFNTETCKKMLVFPPTAERTDFHRLVVQINDDDCTLPSHYCPDWKDEGGKHRFCSWIKGTKCSCGKVMVPTAVPLYQDKNPVNVGVFLKGMDKYLITDDLRVSIIDTLNVNELWKEGVNQVDRLSERKVEVGRQEILSLFKHALMSKTALSDTFIGRKTEKTSGQSLEIAFSKQNSKCKGKKLNMNLVVNKSSGKFLYAQGKEDVANFFFSFLTFPLGLLSNLYNGCSSIGCIDELRSSAKLLSEKGHLRTDEHLDVLFKPKIAAHHSFPGQILNIEEGPFRKTNTALPGAILHAINPKSPSFTTENGGGFVNGPVTFMISDNLEVKAASVSTQLSVFRNHDNVKVIPVTIGEIEALKLLHASLTSTTPPSTVLFDELRAKEAKKVRPKICDGIRQWIKLWKKKRSL